MKDLKLYLVIALIAQLSGCATPDTVSEAEQAAITKEIQERLNGYPIALNKRDLDWFQKFWSNEKDFVFAADGKVTVNYDSAVTSAYRDAFSSIKEITYLNWSNGHALVINKNTVSYTTGFDWQAIMVSGDTVRASGSWLYLFRKTDGHWSVVHSAGTHIYK